MNKPHFVSCLIFSILVIGFFSAMRVVASAAEEWGIEGKLLGKSDRTAEDISGIACSGALGYPRACLVIDDETQFAQWVTMPERGKLVAGDSLPLIDDEFDGKAVELDGEGAAYADGPFFVIGSFGSARNADGSLDDEGASRLKADSPVFRITPFFLGPAGAEPTPVSVAPSAAPTPPVTMSSPNRILAALVNPVGDDQGNETVTLINAGAGTVSLEGWFLVDKMRNRFAVGDVSLAGGMATTILLPKNSIQLSNQGGEVRLVNRDGHTAHVVACSKAQASEQDRTILF